MISRYRVDFLFGSAVTTGPTDCDLTRLDSTKKVKPLGVESQPSRAEPWQH